ncbi:unnamed protein product [Fraxinus pennsylvanica]|uniref:Uncharacterized protein n=1 Tax=Fraxinus pennsylvanica TaxID=56036 RepID=A0AAD1ZHE4_9LAMI|nr:unnamed protein product [Fraxinus pennsylvanica]
MDTQFNNRARIRYYTAAEEEACVVVADNATVSQAFVMGGGSGVGGGGRGSDDGLGSGSQDPNSWNGNESTDSYYQKMIEANPSNSLLLANYAKFLKEVKGDFAKAEEMLLESKLILIELLKLTPNDCYVLASYASFLWDAEGEEEVENQYEIDETDFPPKFFQEASRLPPLAAAS